MFGVSVPEPKFTELSIEPVQITNVESLLELLVAYRTCTGLLEDEYHLVVEEVDEARDLIVKCHLAL